MIGSDEDKTTNLLDDRNNKIFDVKGKEQLFRDFWKDTFRISPEENADFDQETDREISEFINQNIERITPYETANLERLNAENPLTKPITLAEVKNIIQKFKNKAPGCSGINKALLLQLPNEILEELTFIFNLALAMGYFPDLFKYSLLHFINKPGKNNKKS